MAYTPMHPARSGFMRNLVLVVLALATVGLGLFAFVQYDAATKKQAIVEEQLTLIEFAQRKLTDAGITEGKLGDQIQQQIARQEQLRAELETNVAAMEVIEKDLVTLQQKSAELGESNGKLTAEREQLLAERKQLTERMVGLQKKIDELEKTNYAHQKDKDEYRKQVADLQKRLDSAAASLGDTIQQRDQAVAQLASVTQERDTVMQTLETERVRSVERLQQIQAEHEVAIEQTRDEASHNVMQKRYGAAGVPFDAMGNLLDAIFKPEK